MADWKNCKNLLCIRPDNMGDVIMSSPAFRALKETFNCKITLLTSLMGSIIAPHISEIDEVIKVDLPWIKTGNAIQSAQCLDIIEQLKKYHFDAAIIFTVYSQNPLPTALLAYMANIPLRLAYCRENPYNLLTDWIPDKEPYSFIHHQVERDINLVKQIGASTKNENLHLNFTENAYKSCIEKLLSRYINISNGYIVLHAGVSEKKREYPAELWIKTAKLLQHETGKPILLSGSSSEKNLTDYIQQQAEKNIYSIAGLLDIEEFIALIANAEFVVSVNTATVHIAAATQTPIVVLYAQTNPQHYPWKTKSVVLRFSVPIAQQSKNEIIQFVNKQYYLSPIPYPTPNEIVNALKSLKVFTVPDIFCS